MVLFLLVFFSVGILSYFLTQTVGTLSVGTLSVGTLSCFLTQTVGTLSVGTLSCFLPEAKPQGQVEPFSSVRPSVRADIPWDHVRQYVGMSVSM